MNTSCIVFINLSPARRNEHFCHFEQIPCPDKVRKSVSSVTRLAEKSCGNQTMEVQLRLTDCNRAVRSTLFFFGGGGGTHLGVRSLNRTEGLQQTTSFAGIPFGLKGIIHAVTQSMLNFQFVTVFPFPPPFCPPARPGSCWVPSLTNVL